MITLRVAQGLYHTNWFNPQDSFIVIQSLVSLTTDFQLEAREPTHLSKCKLDRHFCLPLHVAMKFGLYLHPKLIGVWHVVSEGS